MDTSAAVSPFVRTATEVMDRLGRNSLSRRTTLFGLLVNAALVAVKLAAGVLGHSYALIADAVESTADIFSSLIVWRGFKVSARAADERHPFGYGKAESIAAAAVALMLLAAALGISVQAVREIITPHHSPAPFTLLVLIVVIATKELLFRYVITIGNQVGSLAVSTDAWHHRSDAITSAAVFVGITLALLGGPTWAPADDYAAVVASVIIAANGVRFLQRALRELMDVAPEADFLAAVEREARAVAGVMNVEKILARKVGTMHSVVIHVQADPASTLAAAHAVGGCVRSHLITAMPSIADVVVHMEPYDGPGAGA